MENMFDEEDTKVKTHADKLRHLVTRQQVERSKELQDHKHVCLQNINTERDSLQQNLKESKRQRDECEDILRSKDVLAILEFKLSPTVNENKGSYNLISQRIPAFTEGEVEVSQLEKKFGTLTFAEAKYQVKEKGTTSPYESIFNFPAHYKDSTSREITETKSANQIIAASPIQLEKYIVPTGWEGVSPIVCIANEQAWIATERRKLKLLDKSGNEIKKKQLTEFFCDAAISEKGEIFVVFDDKKCVCCFTKKETWHKMFTLHRTPNCIFPLKDGNILITYRDDKTVVLYSFTGMVLMKLDCMELGHPLFAAQNKVNGHIYITVKYGVGHYSCQGKMLAIKENGEIIYQYTGQQDTVFTPVDMCTNRNGQVFVTDYVKGSVHILDNEGLFLRYLLLQDCDLVNPCRIDTYDSKYIWISENETERIKVVEYT